MTRFLHQLRARRCLLTAAIVILFLTAVGNVLIDRCPLSARFPEADLTIKSWEAHGSAPEIVFLGSSRSGYALNVEKVASKIRQFSGDQSVQIFNAAVPFGDPLTMKFIGARLFTDGRMPKLAVLEITPDSVARRNRFLDFVVTRQFTLSDTIENFADICHSTNKTLSRVLSSRLIPFYTHRLALRAWAREAWIRPAAVPALGNAQSDYYNGFWGRSSLPQELRGPPPALRVELDIPRVRQQLADYEIPGRTSAALEELVMRCHERGIKIILLEPPMHSALRALFVPSVAEPYRGFVEHLESTYGCRFVDFSGRLPDSLFFDGVHTNAEGREYFSGLFADEVLGPAWRAETTHLRHE